MDAGYRYEYEGTRAPEHLRGLGNRNGVFIMALSLLAVLSVFWLGLAWSEPAYEASCSIRCTGCDTTSVSCTAVGSNRLAVPSVSIYPDWSVTAITYGGVDITAGLVDSHGTFIKQYLYRTIAPAASAQTLEVTINNSVELHLGALLLSGAHQTVPLGTAVKAEGSGTAASATVTTAADELVVATASTAAADIDIAAGANETERWSLSAAGERESAMYTQPGASGGAMTPAVSPSDAWYIIAVSVKPAVAAVTRRVGPMVMP